ncbi:MAG: hypothetical protein GX254_07110 [Clostridiales bacterium]|jgi:putative isomerase|nr:hypothetical protein [Clostridiales bacterium]
MNTTGKIGNLESEDYKKDPYFRNVRQFYRIDGNVFKRRGAWFALFCTANGYGMAELHLGTFRGASVRSKDKNKLIDIFPTYEGRKVPFVVKADAAELTLLTRYGNVRFTYASPTMLVAEGDRGMGLHFEKIMDQHEAVKKRRNGAWEAAFRWTCSFVFKGLKGSSFDFDCQWDWEKLSSFEIKGNTHPGADGTFTLVMEEFTHSGWVREAYPSYEEAKADMQADWDKFYEKMPKFIEPFEEGRREAEYTLWSYIMNPTFNVDHTLMLMIGTEIASQWQMCQNAVALQEHMDIAIDLLLGPMERASPVGQYSDLYNDAITVTQFVKPPMHGWAIKQIMKHHNLLEEVPREKIEQLYESVGRWGDWFMNYRDEDGDGIPAYEHGDETGFDDSTLFREHMQVASPDLCAYLVLLFEAVGDLAVLLEKPKEESGAWYGKSADLLDRLVKKMWDGERFVGLVPYTHERLYSDSYVHYMPIILGNRLPENIVNKIADDLSVEGEFLSPYGIAGERITSDYFDASGRSIGRGNIVPPGNIYICTGLFESCRKDVGKLIAHRYCTALKEQGFPFLIHPILGNVMSYHGGSWPACAYTIICRLLTEEA